LEEFILHPTLSQNLEKQSSKFRKQPEVRRILARLAIIAFAVHQSLREEIRRKIQQGRLAGNDVTDLAALC
jgi:hypothetical protein